MTPHDFKAWRKRLGLNQTEVAARLGISRRLLVYWEAGERPVPKMAELACASLHPPPDAPSEDEANEENEGGEEKSVP